MPCAKHKYTFSGLLPFSQHVIVVLDYTFYTVTNMYMLQFV